MRARAIAYFATREFIPFYGVYALLFADHGLSPTAISSLLIIWSTVSFASEVPSGAWADVIDRRLLLVVSGGMFAAAFATWVVWPTYAGFAVGFVLWGVSSSLMSGTFESLVYDELVARGEESGYAQLLGWATAASIAAATVGIALGGPLYRWGGYAAVGWASVGVAVVHGLLALSLPSAPRAESADELQLGHNGDATLFARWVAMLRAGLREATTHVTVRRIVLITAVLMGVTAYDEYFGLLAREMGVATADIAVLMALVGLGEVAGAALAGRTEAMSKRTMSAVVFVAAVLIAVGAASGHVVGFAGVAVGYGLVHNAIVVSEARLQSAITGRARATVTSVTGFGAEIFAVACYAAFAVGSLWWSIGTMVAIVCLPLVAIAGAVRVWWPEDGVQARATAADEHES